MSDALTCPGCQKRYKFKARYAGRPVKCPCGQILHMPASDPDSQPAAPSASPSPASADGLFELQQPGAAPATADSSTNKTTDAASLGSEDLFELGEVPEPVQTSGELNKALLASALSNRPSAVTQALENRVDEVQLSPWKEKYIPLFILIAGLIVQAILWFVFAKPEHVIVGAIGMVLVQVLLLMPIAIAAMFFTARLMNISFGLMKPALFKASAIAIGSGGVADVLFFTMMLSVDFDATLLLMAFVLHMFLLGLPMLFVFELELGAAMLIVTIVTLPRLAILFAMNHFFPQWF